MATCLMFGTMTRKARKAVNIKRIKSALALVKKHGGAFDTLTAA
jgi:hypothetical protein